MDDGEVAFLGGGDIVRPHSGLPSPTWANADVSCLLSLFMNGLRMGTPQLTLLVEMLLLGKTKVSF